MSTDQLTAGPAIITSGIDRLRRSLTSWIFIEGLGRVLLAVLAFIVLDFVIDWTFHMDKAQRVVMLFLGLGAIGYASWRWLLKPLSLRPSDEALVREVERHHGGLAESLISALEFSRGGWNEETNVSRQMIDATIAGGTEQAGAVDFDAALRADSRNRNRMLLLVAGLGLFGMAVAVASTSTMSTWFKRNVLLGNAQWPLAFYLDVEGAVEGKLVVPRGDDWLLRARLRQGSRSKPDNALLEIDTPGGTRKESMDRLEGGRIFQRTLRNVSDELSIRISSGRFATDWVRVSLIDRPAVEGIRLTATAPKYAGGAVVDLPAEKGPHYLLKGTQLKIEGQATKPLSSAVLRLGEATWNMTISDQDRFVAELGAKETAAGQYEIELFDTEKIILPGSDQPTALSSIQPARFTLRAKPDKTPDVKAALRGIGNLVVPGARIPYTARIEDDFAVTECQLVYRTRNDEKGESAEGAVVPAGLEDKLGKSRIAYDAVFQLAPLKLSEGSSLSLFVEALDNDDVSGPKAGESSKFLLRVVSAAELRTDLLRREKEQRMAIERLIREQDDLYTATQTFQAETKDAAALAEEFQDRLVRLEKKQKLLGSNLPRIANRLSGLILEAQNNGLEGEDGVLRERLDKKVIGPLRNLAANAVPMTAENLELARRKHEAAPERNEALSRAVSGQEGIIDSLNTILQAMVKSAEFQEAVNLLYEIQQSQDQLKEQTQKEKEDRVRQIFEKGGEDK